MIKKDKRMKESLTRKEIIKEKKTEVAKTRWMGLAHKGLMMKESVDGKMPKLSRELVNLARAKAGEAAALKVIQENSESSPIVQRHEIHVHREDEGETHYTNIDEMRTNMNGNSYPFSPEARMIISTDSEAEPDLQPNLVIPKVENDEWPDENDYAVANGPDDVHF